MIKNTILIFLSLLLISCSGQVKSAEDKEETKADICINCNQKLSKVLDSLNIKKGDIHILVDKSDYQLYVMHGETKIKSYPIVLGDNPVDDKLREGDQCTPEGTFQMVGKYPHRSWKKFVWINYPTADSWRKHNKAKEDGKIPRSASIGGEIGIHGVPGDSDELIDNGVNWTLGCISLKNADIEELYPYFTKSMDIVIRK